MLGVGTDVVRGEVSVMQVTNEVAQVVARSGQMLDTTQEEASSIW